MEVSKSFTLEAAHWLPNVSEGHKCGRMHGHSFHVEVTVSGEVGAESGWVMDFAEIKRVFQPIHDLLDHNCLNNIPGLENPTSESLAKWIWQRLAADLPGLCRITIQETCTSRCSYTGEVTG
ncbi:MAG: 6-carboxytetrahydropterin synthase QueD [Armatimonadetes bacterium]|nr:6-carboxytetrahydropterin synthase QueD [Armatimonadota bacterium]